MFCLKFNVYGIATVLKHSFSVPFKAVRFKLI